MLFGALSQQTTYLDKTIKLLGDIAALEGKWPQACDYWFQTLQSGDNAIRIDAYRKLINYYDSLAEYDEKHHRMASHLSQRLNTLYRDHYENNGATSIFQPSEIAILVASSPQSITNLRVRLLQKLFNETGGAKDFDQRICQNV